MYEHPAFFCRSLGLRVPLLLTQKGEGGSQTRRYRPPVRPGHTPLAALRLLAPLYVFDEGGVPQPLPLPGHTPAFASLRVPFRESKGDGGGFIVGIMIW